MYATDSIIMVIDGVGREFVASGLACFASNSSFAWTFLSTQFCQTYEVWTQFHNLGFRKTKFLSSPSKRLRCIHIGAKADDNYLFQHSRLRQCAPDLAHEIYYTWCKLLEKMRQRWCSDRSCTWSIITTFVRVDRHHETEDENSRLRAAQEKSRLHARISFLLVSWGIYMCERIYRKNYNIHVRY